jgi:uncharacterized membrane protein HdeD (DUF308 family)
MERERLRFARSSGALAARGVAGLFFGLIAFGWPRVGLPTATGIFALYALTDGVLALAAVIRAGVGRQPWWGLYGEGIVDVAVGLFTILAPPPSVVGLAYYIAAWALITGALEIAATLQLRAQVPSGLLLGISGVASLTLGALLLAEPSDELLGLVWAWGVYAVLAGVLRAWLGLHLRTLPPQRGRWATA